MLVVWRDSVPDVGAPLPPLQLVESPPDRTMEGGERGDGLDSRQMPARADL